MKTQFLSVCLLVIGVTASGQNLFVGANFHPHDYQTEQEIDAQISLMKEAGFNAVLFRSYGAGWRG